MKKHEAMLILTETLIHDWGKDRISFGLSHEVVCALSFSFFSFFLFFLRQELTMSPWLALNLLILLPLLGSGDLRHGPPFLDYEGFFFLN